jgi:ATP-dependent Zn protease
MKHLHSENRRARGVPRIDEGAIDSGSRPDHTPPTHPSVLTQDRLIGAATTDVGATRERVRQRRMRRLSLVLAPIATWLVLRALVLHRGALSLPHLPSSTHTYLPAIALIVVLVAVMVVPLVGAGRSPHVLFRPGETDVSLNDVRGSKTVVEEVVKTLNLFLAHKTFGESMGGTPRRGVLFEGPPGTGKTYLAKAMASEAGVPFLFVSSSAFQSMFYGQTNRKIRSYFRMLRKYARLEGGAIGFIEEIDAIGASRSGMGSGHREGVAGVVNELLIQLQSFDTPPLGVKIGAALTSVVNLWLPAHRQRRKPTASRANILVIGATNRASDLDPALLRPGRFDRSIYFDLPTRAGRRDIIDFYLGRKAHEADLDTDERRDTLAAITMGYSPAMLEHLLDEALVWALRRGATRLSWEDLTHAKMTEEIGLAQETVYTTAERRLIATHESGHATVAWLVGKGRKLEVLSIVKRKDALGLLAHADTEERFLRTTSEIVSLIEIAFGGMVAEELFIGESTTGVSGDLKGATDLACQMIGAFGMGSTLSSHIAVEMPGAGNLAARVLSDEKARGEVEAMLRVAKDHVRAMLDEHRHVVEALRDALIARDELIGHEIIDVIVRAGPAVTVPVAG